MNPYTGFDLFAYYSFYTYDFLDNIFIGVQVIVSVSVVHFYMVAVCDYCYCESAVPIANVSTGKTPVLQTRALRRTFAAPCKR